MLSNSLSSHTKAYVQVVPCAKSFGVPFNPSFTYHVIYVFEIWVVYLSEVIYSHHT